MKSKDKSNQKIYISVYSMYTYIRFLSYQNLKIILCIQYLA